MASKIVKKPVNAPVKMAAAQPAAGASTDGATQKITTKEDATTKSPAQKQGASKTDAPTAKRPASRSQTPPASKATPNSVKDTAAQTEKIEAKKTAIASKTKASSRAMSPSAATKSSINPLSAPARKSASVAKLSQKPPLSPAPTHAGRVTKQERVLTLLRQSGGASLDEIVDVTDWRIHSIRGFLAGTVKKKLGYALSSARGADNVRRYKIPARPAVR